MFFDARRYDLAKVGRYKFNKKLLLRNRIAGHVLAEDVVSEYTGEIIAHHPRICGHCCGIAGPEAAAERRFTRSDDAHRSLKGYAAARHSLRGKHGCNRTLHFAAQTACSRAHPNYELLTKQSYIKK